MTEAIYPPVSNSQKAWTFVSVSVLLSNYYFLYFVDFHQGLANAGFLFSFMKIIGVVLICSVFLSASICLKYTIEAVVLIFFLLFSILIYVLKSIEIGVSDAMYFNGVFCLAPFLLLRFGADLNRVRFFFECCVVIIAMQILLDLIIYMAGYSLWENKAFIGGLGNPSSFGFVCNVLMCYVLFERKGGASSVLFFLALAYGVYMTSSMLALLLLAFVITYWVFSKVTISRVLLGIICVSLGVLFVSSSWGGHVQYKLASIAGLVTGEKDAQSLSVSLRVQNIFEYIGNFSGSPVAGLFYGFTERSYYGYDSQYLTYASSFGAFLSLLFCLAIIVLYFRLRHESKWYFLSVIVLLFGIAFSVNRFMDYYPLPIFLAVILCVHRELVRQRNAGRWVAADAPGT